MMNWAFLAGDQPAPDFEGTVKALRKLVLSLRPAEGEDPVERAVVAAGAAGVVNVPTPVV